MLRTFTNTDVHGRVWPHIQRPDGSTLELAPGESAEVDLPEEFSDPHLSDAKPKGPAKKNATQPGEPAKPEE